MRRRILVMACYAATLVACTPSAHSVSSAGPTTAAVLEDATTTAVVPATVPATVPTTTVPATVPTTTLPATTKPPAADPCESAVPPPVEPDPRRPSYEVTARIDPDSGQAEGRLTARFSPDRVTDRLVLRLWPNSPRLARLGARLSAQVLTSAPPISAIDATDPTTMVLRLAEPLAAGSVATFELSWALQLANQVPERVAFAPGWARLGSFLPLLAWEPGVGWALDPATEGNAEASTFPAADVDLTVSVPDGFQVYATGVPKGGNRFVGVGVRDVAISVARFRQVETVVMAPDPVTVRVGVEAGLGEDPAGYAATVVATLVNFSERFGRYPFETYQLAVTPLLRGGIEYPGLVMQGPGSGGRTTPHEVAHQWFYALVGNDQGRDPVLDEGLATYAEMTYLDTVGGLSDLDLAPGEAGQMGRPMSYWDDHLDDYYAGVYIRGAFALLSLGPQQRVDCALARYVARYAYRIATPADLLASLVGVFPEGATTLARYGLGPT